ncbi:MAG: sigma-70 family RNA polymerase sigma factor, partial [Sinomicrobium sp.]|nr:sigma-70 family RNA polymerase sigma factor [Sinomicrobium sp.]
ASLEELPFLPILVEEAPWQEAPSDNMGQLARVLEQIPEEDKGILFMKYRDNLSIKEIASALDKSESAVKMRIKRAKAKARERRAELISAD